IRKGEIVRVSEWHAEELQRQGLQLIERVRVECPGMRNGANANLRVTHEEVRVFRKPRWERRGACTTSVSWYIRHGPGMSASLCRPTCRRWRRWRRTRRGR